MMLKELVSDLDKQKEDMLIDFIMEYKEVRGYLPKNLQLSPDWIPNSLAQTMKITIDDVDIPIYPIGGFIS
jgi:hypothetical protein